MRRPGNPSRHVGILTVRKLRQRAGFVNGILVYKILPASLWRDAEKAGVFGGTEADLADGFIHFSTEGQIRETAQKYFAGQDGLLLIAADKNRLGGALRFEASRGGALFPHLYATLQLDAVVFAKPLTLLPDGRHDFAGLVG